MRQSRQDMLRQTFNKFNHILGESLEAQLQRFTALITEMSSVGILVTRSEINKMLLNSFPKSWDMNMSVIKKTKDLNRLSMDETMAIIKACDLDDKQREINHVNSYFTANLGIQSNIAFASFTTPQVQSFVAPQPSSYATPFMQSVQPPVSYPQVASSSKAPSPAPAPKENDENLALATGLANCYNAFVAGELPPQLSFADLDQIHPKDVKEMDITWQIAMAVFRAKEFSKKTGKNKWGINAEKKVGFNKGKLRCFNCHEPNHFAKDFPKPDRRENNVGRNDGVG
ncbi:hypothetical protein Lser_V15G04550 [Lactuca serriola]